MKVTLGPIISKASGVIASSLFRSTPHGAVVSQKPRARLRQTNASTSAQRAFARASKLWTGLSLEDKLEWELLSTAWDNSIQTPKTTKLSPSQVFQKHMVKFIVAGIEPDTSPPENLKTIKVFFTQVQTIISFTWTAIAAWEPSDIEATLFFYVGRTFSLVKRQPKWIALLGARTEDSPGRLVLDSNLWPAGGSPETNEFYYWRMEIFATQDLLGSVFTGVGQRIDI